MAKSETMEDHYNQGNEVNRLHENSVERLRTESILGRFLPSPPAKILDVGGGAGAYSFSLAHKGYEVHLVDPVEVHIREAQLHNQNSSRKLKSLSVGDARSLSFEKDSTDGVLYLGPLYHLTRKDDRVKALKEALRVLKPGGIFVGAFIAQFTSLIDGIRGGYLSDPIFRQIVNQDLATSHHKNPSSHPAYFTDAFFHHPKAALSEVEESGFKNCKLISIEGPIWMIDGLDKQLAQPELRNQILSLLEKIEGEETLIGASGHFMVIAQK